MDRSLPNAKSSKSPGERNRLRRIVSERNLVGLANDTKWDELIVAMRTLDGWNPRFRSKCIDGAPSAWDGEWFYNLPFPFISVEWFDLEFLEETRDHRLPPCIEVIDHAPFIEELLKRIGLEYLKGTKMIRIFGYSPKNDESFDQYGPTCRYTDERRL